MTNARLAGLFEEVASLLERQGASAQRVRVWRDGARGIREHHREVTDVFRDHGRVGLEAIPGIGRKLSDMIVEVIRSGRCSVLGRLRGEAASQLEWLPFAHRSRADEPSVDLLLSIDGEYRKAAATGRSIMHVDRDGWLFTALFSNTELAHHFHRTDDWVVIYFHRRHEPEAHATVVTERCGGLRGQRVVRSRERECMTHWTDFERRAS